MRPIGTLPDEAQARRFEDHLLSLEIHSMVEPAGEAWEVWVRDDRHIERAAAELARFRQDPENERHRGAGEQSGPDCPPRIKVGHRIHLLYALQPSPLCKLPSCRLRSRHSSLIGSIAA